MLKSWRSNSTITETNEQQQQQQHSLRDIFGIKKKQHTTATTTTRTPHTTKNNAWATTEADLDNLNASIRSPVRSPPPPNQKPQQPQQQPQRTLSTNTLRSPDRKQQRPLFPTKPTQDSSRTRNDFHFERNANANAAAWTSPKTSYGSRRDEIIAEPEETASELESESEIIDLKEDASFASNDTIKVRRKDFGGEPRTSMDTSTQLRGDTRTSHNVFQPPTFQRVHHSQQRKDPTSPPLTSHTYVPPSNSWKTTNHEQNALRSSNNLESALSLTERKEVPTNTDDSSLLEYEEGDTTTESSCVDHEDDLEESELLSSTSQMFPLHDFEVMLVDRYKQDVNSIADIRSQLLRTQKHVRHLRTYMRDLARNDLRRFEIATVHIQAFWRGHLVRRAMARFGLDRKTLREDAARKLRWWRVAGAEGAVALWDRCDGFRRGRGTERRMGASGGERDEGSEVEAEGSGEWDGGSVVLCQASVRGWIVRREVRKFGEEKERRRRAAVRIQAFWRGHLARKNNTTTTVALRLLRIARRSTAETHRTIATLRDQLAAEREARIRQDDALAGLIKEFERVKSEVRFRQSVSVSGSASVRESETETEPSPRNLTSSDQPPAASNPTPHTPQSAPTSTSNKSNMPKLLQPASMLFSPQSAGSIDFRDLASSSSISVLASASTAVSIPISTGSVATASIPDRPPPPPPSPTQQLRKKQQQQQQHQQQQHQQQQHHHHFPSTPLRFFQRAFASSPSKDPVFPPTDQTPPHIDAPLRSSLPLLTISSSSSSSFTSSSHSSSARAVSPSRPPIPPQFTPQIPTVANGRFVTLEDYEYLKAEVDCLRLSYERILGDSAKATATVTATATAMGDADAKAGGDRREELARESTVKDASDRDREDRGDGDRRIPTPSTMASSGAPEHATEDDDVDVPVRSPPSLFTSSRTTETSSVTEVAETSGITVDGDDETVRREAVPSSRISDSNGERRQEETSDEMEEMPGKEEIVPPCPTKSDVVVPAGKVSGIRPPPLSPAAIAAAAAAAAGDAEAIVAAIAVSKPLPKVSTSSPSLEPAKAEAAALDDEEFHDTSSEPLDLIETEEEEEDDDDDEGEEEKEKEELV